MNGTVLRWRWVERTSVAGHTYRDLEPVMPIIPPEFRDCVVYIYPSAEAAEESERLGGTGFLVGIPMDGHEEEQVAHAYVVTNKHALGSAEAPAIRLNQLSGNWDVLPTQREQWLDHPDGDDLSVFLAAGITEKRHRVLGVPPGDFVTREMADEGLIGLGDEAWMVSRLSALAEDEGRYSRNAPVVRFGNIASDLLTLRHPRYGTNEQSFLVEGTSLAGHSGSPVFVWVDPKRERQRRGALLLGKPYILRLLGIDWCHLRATEKLRANDDENVESEDWHVRANSGMMGVIPAWRIWEVLDTDEARQQRVEERAEWERLNPPGSGGAELDSEDAPAFTREAFLRDLAKVKRDPPDKKTPPEEGIP